MWVLDIVCHFCLMLLKVGLQKTSNNFLGKKNTTDTLSTTVKQAHKINLKSLELTSDYLANTIPYHEGKGAYLSEPRLYQLIFSLRLKAANSFWTWVFEKILTYIRKSGGFKLQVMKNEIRRRIQKNNNIFCSLKDKKSTHKIIYMLQI